MNGEKALLRKSFHLTKAGVETLRLELESLKVQRTPIAERIKAAREFGDLSENAEYSSARQEQERVESRITEIEHILRNVQLIPQPKSGSEVQLGSCVTLRDREAGEQQFKIVGTVEADPLKGLISNESPLGQALLGKTIGEEIEVKSRAGVTVFAILEIR